MADTFQVGSFGKLGALPGAWGMGRMGLFLMLVGLLLVAYVNFVAATPPAIGPREGLTMAQQQAARQAIVMRAVMVLAGDAIFVIGFVVTLAFTIVYFATQGKFVEGARAGIAMRWVAPGGAFLMAGFIVLGLVAVRMQPWLRARERARQLALEPMQRAEQEKAEAEQRAKAHTKLVGQTSQFIVDLESPDARVREKALSVLSHDISVPHGLLEEVSSDDRKRLLETISHSREKLVTGPNSFRRLVKIVRYFDSAAAEALDAEYRQSPEHFFAVESDAMQVVAQEALTQGDTAVVRHLLDVGFDPLKPNRQGQSMFVYAMWNHVVPVLRLMLEHKLPADTAYKGSSPLVYFCTEYNESRTEYMKLFLEFHANADQCDAQGNPLLCEVVRWRDAASARLLLEHGANANAVDGAGRTAMDYAAALVAMGGARVFVTLLLGFGGKSGRELVASERR